MVEPGGEKDAITHQGEATGYGRAKKILLIAGKEIQEALRHRWVLATTLLLAALALTFLGSVPAGNVGVL